MKKAIFLLALSLLTIVGTATVRASVSTVSTHVAKSNSIELTANMKLGAVGSHLAIKNQQAVYYLGTYDVYVDGEYIGTYDVYLVTAD